MSKNILMNFDTWGHARLNMERIYLRGWIWTPFVRIVYPLKERVGE